MSIQNILAKLFPAAPVVVDPLQSWVDKVASQDAIAAKQKADDEAEVALFEREQELKGKYQAIKAQALTNTKFLKAKKEQLKAAILLEDRMIEFSDFCIDDMEMVPPPEIRQEIAKLTDVEFQQWMQAVKACTTEDELNALIAQALL